MSMRRFMTGATGGLVIALGAGNISTLQAQGQGTPIGVDVPFLAQVGSGNLLEIRLGQTAEKKASNPSVKQYANQAVVDHTSMQRQWMTVASKNRVPFKVTLSSQQEAQIKQLDNLSGAEFDRTYMNLTAQNDRESANAFETERRRVAHPAEVQSLLDQNLVSLQNHLTMAQQLGGQVLAGGPVGGSTGLPLPGPTTPNLKADSAFISEVDAGNVAELKLASLAGSRAVNPEVKSFAQRMSTDHSSMRAQWAALTSRYGLRLNANISPQHEEQITRLGRLSGTEFDRAYMAAMVQNHQDNLNSLQSRGRAAQSSDVRQLVERSLPTVQQHLTLAQQVANSVGATTVASGADTTSDYSNTPDGRGKNGSIKGDAKFIRDVDAHHFLQVRLGRLAQEKGRDTEVKRFGKRMEQDHSAMEKQWNDMASHNGMKYKSGMGPDNQANLDRLEKTSGKSFDRAYMTLMIQTHNAYLNYWRKEGRAAHTPAVRQLVNEGLPTLEEHMNMAKRIGKRVGVDVDDALAGRRVAQD